MACDFRFECRVIKITSEGGPLASSRLLDGHIMKKASKAFGLAPREAKDEVQRENQFSSILPHSRRDLQAEL